MAVISKHRDGDIVLFERHDSPYIFCRLRFPDGGWDTRSSKSKQELTALAKAEKWHDEITFLHGRGMSPKRRTFSAICDLYLKELAEEVRLGFRNERILKDYKAIITRYLRPYFGRKYIDLITAQDMADYRKWRAIYWTDGPGAKIEHLIYVRGGKKIKRPKPKGKPPSITVQNTENVVLRAVFGTALKHGVLTEVQIPPFKIEKRNRGTKSRRPHFTKDEYDQLIQFLHEWPDEEGCQNPDRRRLLKHYVIFLFHTGLRPGTETDNLCWKHLRQTKIKNGEHRYVLSVSGKTGPRSPVAAGPAYAALNQIKLDMVAADNEPTPSGAVFSLPNGEAVKNDYFRHLFRTALDKSGLLVDADGQQRSLYSLRHSYATFQLLYNKVSVYLLKEQMGTSISMIERHYGHLTPEMAIDELTEKSVDNFL